MMPFLPRTASKSRYWALALFRVHIENGFSVALGVGLTGMVVGAFWGFDAGVAAASGAVAVSVSDQPDPLPQKPWILAFAVAITLLFAGLAVAAPFAPGSFIPVVIFTGLWTGLISAYGKRALSLSMTGVLALVYAMGRHFEAPAEAFSYFRWLMAGAIFYAVYAGLIALWFDDRARRLLLAEAMRSFASYLRAQAALYAPGSEGRVPFHALIDTHTALTERLQTARDALFSGTRRALQKKRIDALVALLDTFEAMLASDADYGLLRHSRRASLKARMHDFILKMAEDVDGLTLSLRPRRAHVSRHARDSEALVQAVQESNTGHSEGRTLDHAYTVTANKLRVADERLTQLAVALDDRTPPSDLADQLNLDPFRAPPPKGLRVLWNQLGVERPAFRYALRLAAAMTAGFLITRLFPHFAHANWILLTIALIMRANYSVTRKRRWDRITGTLIGSVIAVALIPLSPPPLLLAAIVLAIGLSHAYAGVQYRITALSASISSLLLLHFSAPAPQFLERIVDTLIGAALSYVFSFFLPSWERNQLPRLVEALLKADRIFAGAALRLDHPPQAYRLARKQMLEAVAQLAGAIQRLSDEPNANRRTLAALNELLAANYALASDLTSLPILVELRGPELDAARAEDAIAKAQETTLALLGGEERQAPAWEESAEETMAMTVLAYRLAHIANNAGKVARLASRPLLAAS